MVAAVHGKKIYTARLVIALFLFLLITSCNNRETIVDKGSLTGDDYRLFQNTPAWELAKAVQDDNVKKITEIIAKNPQLVNYQEPKYGSTLLMLTVRNQQYKSFDLLLKNNADVNVHETYEGSTVLIESCKSKYYDSKYAEALLKYGANVNETQTDIENQDKTKTALMVVVKTGNLDLVKLLVLNGANINYKNEFGQSALSECVMQEKYEVAIFLLRNGADYKQPIFYRPGDSADYNPEKDKPMYLVDVLREDFFELDTEEYKYKMQIVDFLKSNGIDYRATPIPEYIKRKAQDNYPNNWKEYLEKY